MFFVWIELKEWRSDLRFRSSENKRRDPFYNNELWYIDTFHVHITCRDGVLLVEDGHTTWVFLLCTSLMDEEADNRANIISCPADVHNRAVACEANYWTLLQDSVCPILQAVSSILSCKLIEETCERKFATHFDYCTTATLDFISLDETTFRNIIQVGFHM